MIVRQSAAKTYTGTLAVAEQNVAAVGAGDVAGDGEAEPGAAFVLVARVVEPQKRLEHLLAHPGRNPGAVVVHRDGQPAMIAMPGDRNRAREARRIGHQISKTAAERGGPHGDERLAVERRAGPV